MTFKVGDRIKVRTRHKFGGDIGTVILVSQSDVGVVFDTYNDARHNLGGRCSKGYGWWFWNSKSRLTSLSKEDTIDNWE